MRDILVATLILGAIPWMLARPYVGLLFWIGIGFLNPHRMTYGFAYDFPFVQIVAIVTILALVFSGESKRIPLTGASVAWFAFTVWGTFATFLALNPDFAWLEWERFIKIQVMVAMMLMMLTSRERIDGAVWVIAGSLAFFGVKGGIFTLLSGGQFMVWGPPATFIEGNNEIAFALVVVLPWLWYLRHHVTKRWVKMALLASSGLCLFAVVGSYSRGAFLAMAAMLSFLVLRSRHKLVAVSAMIPLAIGALLFMPQQWVDRMNTIQTYQQDESAMGRINAWKFAINLANDRPMVGGGFRAFTPELFQRYAPEPERHHDAHSILFEVLGEMGYVGLLIYLAMGLATFLLCSRIGRMVRNRPDLEWAQDLARMSQVALVGFLVGGAFLGLAYFDLPYAIMAVVVATHAVVRRDLAVSATQPSDDRLSATVPGSSEVPVRGVPSGTGG